MRIVGFSLAVVLAAGIGCATVPPCPAKGGPPWREYSSPHFDLRTDLEAKDAEEVVRTLEETRAAMLAMTWAGLPEPRTRTLVIVLGSGLELAAFTGFGIGGTYVRPAPFPPTLVFAGASFRGIETLKHELAHDLSFWFLPFQPDWYSEGIATFLETTTYDRAQRRASVGEASQSRALELKRSGIYDVRRLLASKPVDVVELGSFETTSWILVHYLLNHEGEAFTRFQQRLGAMQLPQQAWREEFPGLDTIALEDKLTRYVRSGRYVVSTFTLAPWQGKADVRPMSDAEVHAVRAYLYSFVHPEGGKPKAKEASAEIDEAMSVERAPVDALAVAFYSRDVKDKGTRAALARRAVDTHPESWLAWLMLADSTDPKDPAHQTALARALARAPEEPEVLARMATLKASNQRWDDALSFSSKAMRRRAIHSNLWSVHLTALAKTGRCSEAALWATAVLGYLPAWEARSMAARWNRLKDACVSVPVR